MLSTYNQRLLPLGLLGIIVIIGFSFLAVQTPEQQLGFATVVPEGYSLTDEFLTQEDLLDISFVAIQKAVTDSDEENFPNVPVITPAIVNVSITTVDDSNTYVFNKAHLSYKGAAWQPVTLRATNEELQQGSWTSSWIRGPTQAHHVLELDPSFDPHTTYVTVFTCRAYDKTTIEDSDELSSDEKTALLEEYFPQNTQRAFICGFDTQKNHGNWRLQEYGTGIGTSLYIAGFDVQQETITPGEELTGNWVLYGATQLIGCEVTTPQVNSNDIDYDSEYDNHFSIQLPEDLSGEELTLTLTCENEFQITTRELTIPITNGNTITPPGSGAEPSNPVSPLSCDNSQGQLRPTSWARELNIVADMPSQEYTSWSDLYGLPFPRGDARNLRVDKNQYIALEFNSGTLGSSGQMNFADLGGNIVGVGTRPAIVSISECPGDFRAQTEEQRRCMITGVGGANPSFQWSRNPDDSLSKCFIEPNKDYYLNIAYVSQASYERSPKDFTWECRSDYPTWPCGHRISNTFSQ